MSRSNVKVKINPNFEKEIMNAVTESLNETEFELECPHCSKTISVSVGKCTCPYCGNQINVELKL